MSDGARQDTDHTYPNQTKGYESEGDQRKHGEKTGYEEQSGNYRERYPQETIELWCHYKISCSLKYLLLPLMVFASLVPSGKVR